MTRLPRISGKKMVSALGNAGFRVIRIKGSHYFLRHNDGRCTVIPVHRSEILGPGITSQILRDCELTIQDLEKLL
ncbi:MAG: addiction module toxin, HicA family [Chloroflexi bacterium]|nr:addiction module toxin, HicA family [Chloroflexota bacterium]